jgi:multiple sugar transport system permease protein
MGTGTTAAAPRHAGLPATQPPKRRSKPRRQLLLPYGLLTPFLAAFAAFLLVPLGYALYLSLYRTQLIGGRHFVGTSNYASALHDRRFWDGVTRMAVFFLMQVPIMIGLALLAALVLDGALMYLRRVFRLAFFLPYAVPSVVAALMWGYLYGPNFGPISQVVRNLGASPPNLLGESWMLPSIANVVTWEWTGYNMLVLFAALQAVPRDLREAASLDGANAWQTAWRLRIPLVRPALVLVTVFSVIGTLQLFNEPQIMHTLAPSVISESYTPNLYAYNLSFSEQRYEYSAAISFLLGAVVFVGSYVFMLTTSRREKSER